MEEFLGFLKSQSANMDIALAQPRFAVVSSVDPQTYSARVAFQPEGVLSGWLPISAAWSGPGWGMACPPSPGQQVVVIAQEGHAEHGIIIGTAFSQLAQPPAAPSGEFWLVHASGSYIKLTNQGDVIIEAQNLQINTNVTINGSLSVTESISDINGQVGTLGG